jgi:putative ABC transport system substrate-binding protein
LGSLRERAEIEAAARTLDLDITPLNLRSPDQDLTLDFDALKGRVDAIYVGTGPLVTLKRSHIFPLALAARLPTVGGLRAYAQVGGLISYGPDYGDLFRRAGSYIDKILRAMNPGDIPIEQPTNFELVINVKAAKFLGFEIPTTLLIRADEVIE